MRTSARWIASLLSLALVSSTPGVGSYAVAAQVAASAAAPASLANGGLAGARVPGAPSGMGVTAGLSPALSAPAGLSLPAAAPLAPAVDTSRIPAAMSASLISAVPSALPAPAVARAAVPVLPSAPAGARPVAVAVVEGPADPGRGLAVAGKAFARAQAGVDAVRGDKAIAALSLGKASPLSLQSAGGAAFDNAGERPELGTAVAAEGSPASPKEAGKVQAALRGTAAFAELRLDGRGVDAVPQASSRETSARPLPSTGLSGVTYWAKRWILTGLASAFGIVLSLPVVGSRLVSRILAEAARKTTVFSDYDDTMEGFRQIASPETVEVIGALREAGKTLVVITDRPDKNRDGSAKGTIVESLSSIPADKRAGLIFAANKGGRIFRYNAAGEPVLIYEEPPLEDAVVAKVRDAAEAVKAQLASLGAKPHDGSKNIAAESYNPYGYAMMLEAGTPESTVKAVAAALQKELRSRGLEFEVEPRMAKDAANPPYVTFSKLDKSLAVRRVAELLGISAEEALILGDSMFVPKAAQARGVRGWLLWLATRFGEWLSGRRAQITGNGTDRDMERSLPGALTLSVGGTADPRMRNAFVMPGKGPEASRGVLRVMATGDPYALEWKDGTASYARTWGGPLDRFYPTEALLDELHADQYRYHDGSAPLTRETLRRYLSIVTLSLPAGQFMAGPPRREELAMLANARSVSDAAREWEQQVMAQNPDVVKVEFGRMHDDSTFLRRWMMDRWVPVVRVTFSDPAAARTAVLPELEGYRVVRSRDWRTEEATRGRRADGARPLNAGQQEGSIGAPGLFFVLALFFWLNFLWSPGLVLFNASSALTYLAYYLGSKAAKGDSLDRIRRADNS